MDDLDDLFGEYPIDFYSMELFGDHYINIAIPKFADYTLKKYLLAALKTYSLRNKSIDRVLKEYGKYWKFENCSRKEKEICGILKTILSETNRILNKVAASGEKRNILGTVVAEGALIRLKATFRATSMLIGQHYNIEAAMLMRNILEQIAWAYQVNEKDDRFEIIKSKPSKSIEYLQSILPKSKFGLLYGYLSDMGHLNPKTFRHYIKVENDQHIVKLSMKEETPGMLYVFASLCDCLGIISEIISKNNIITFDYINIRNSKPKRKRPLSPLIKKLRHSLKKNK